MRIRRLSPLAFAVALTTGAATSCGTGPPPRSDIAIIESGDAEIREIDRVAVRGSPIGEFPVRPGAHTLGVTASQFKAGLFYNTIYRSGLIGLCLKARGGRRYRIKASLDHNRVRVVVIDRATGQPPVTPCGPDEDDD